MWTSLTQTFAVALLALPSVAAEPEVVSFESKDGLLITADLYKPHEARIDGKATPFIVLFHQAGWSRGEYREIAPRLNELGFNCLAIDQRSGKEVNEVPNETVARANTKGLPTSYVDAEQDLIAALEFAKKKYAKGKVVAWGSSYSSALVLRIAGENPELVDGVLAFAPGEYFQRSGKPADWIQKSAEKIKCPVFITSAKKEEPSWKAIYDAIPGEKKAFFLPKTEGNHGSRALWEQFEDSKEYWRATETFLKAHCVPARPDPPAPKVPADSDGS